jgi:hypothetical protein
MKKSPRVTSIAAAAGMAAMLSAPLPAHALDSGNAFAKMQHRHHGPARVATYRPVRQAVAPTAANLACNYGVWCGRQFVLMVGIAY